MILRVVSGIGRATLALVREYPRAWIGVVGWSVLLTTLALIGGAVFHDVRTSLMSIEESFGIHVLVAPDAAGLAALNQAIGRLSGVRDARFVVRPQPLLGFPDTLQPRTQRASLYVRTRSIRPDSLQEVAAALRSFPQVEAAVYSPEMAQRVIDARTVSGQLTCAAWGIAGVMVLVTAWLPGIGLVRSHRRQAIVAYALGASRLLSSAPAGIAGAIGSACGGGIAWLVISTVGSAGSAGMHLASRHASKHGGILLLCVTVLGAVGPLMAINGDLRGRRPTHLDAGAP